MTVPTARPASADLDDLIDQSLHFGGAIRWVQGAGGNLSVKAGGVIWIKASGTRLKEAGDRPIFIPLDLAAAATAVLDTEDLASFVLDPGTSLRPSIETAIHTLLPHRFVSHVHSVGAIAAAIRADTDAAVRALSGIARTVVVPYARPGIPLARVILRTLTAEPVDADIPLIALLGNHGVIAGAPTSAQVVDVLERVEETLGGVARPYRPPVGDGEWRQLAPAGTLTPPQAAVLLGGPLTPDQAVFMGARPFAAAEGQIPDGTLGRIWADGSIDVRAETSADAAEIAASFIDIARIVPPGAEVNYLTEANVDELVNWDAEKWRKEQES